ncbi:IS630 family transposase [Anaerohalosphaera lusitana]|uniref:IS630 family transposase n=1 Tax=Anaerohalosphaera lusitana TaxID=1936003 RepID=UPI0011BADEF5|nr:IS630 family transposase [Anaerohalosphaera lusitana]
MVGASPLFVQKVRTENPEKKIEIWFQDEVRIGQQGTLTDVWAPKGSRPTAVKQTEYDWVYIFGAVNPVNGKSSAVITPTVNTDYMNHHLRFISEEAGKDVHVVLVLDQAGWHIAKQLVVPKNISLLHLPAYSPELNPIERLWAYMKSHYLSNRIYKNYEEIFNAGTVAWNNITSEMFCSICNTEWIKHEN